ncbi:hypothetical protein J6590_071214 [Homalodisca vitripennis]|nr:hypothetical protein J6590_071214 [Homalodisca vitripennis]
MKGFAALVALTFILAVGPVLAKDSSSAEIKWGVTSSNCESCHEVKPTSRKTFRATDSAHPIVGVFATRDDVTDDIWGKGMVRGTKIAKKQCYQQARAYFSVVSGTSNEPLTVDVTLGTMAREVCSYGYTIKVCYKN